MIPILNQTCTPHAFTAHTIVVISLGRFSYFSASIILHQFLHTILAYILLTQTHSHISIYSQSDAADHSSGDRPAVKAKPRMERNRVLVTGGAGFVGSHLCDYLVARGDHVRLFHRILLFLLHSLPCFFYLFLKK